MTEPELHALIAQGESLTVEFKRDAPLPDQDLVDAVVCLANTEGGTLLFGVEDDGAISGLHKTHLPFNARQLEALIGNRTIPGIRVHISSVIIETKHVVVIAVDKAGRVVQTSDGRALARVIAGRGEPECRPMILNDVASRITSLGHYDYSAQLMSNATWQDLDSLAFEQLRQTIEDNTHSDKTLEGLSDEDLAKALELAVSHEGHLVPSVAGLLLVGRERAIRTFLPTHEVAFQVLGDSNSVEFNQFYREPLVKIFFRFIDLLEARNREEEVYVLGQRIGVPLYSPSAFREALANALTHRDYAKLNAVYVRLNHYPGSLSISNPGGFVEGITLNNLLVTGPKPRNRLLADAFKRLGLVERTGRGIERIYEAVLGLGRQAPDYSQSDRTTVKVVMPGEQADLAFVKLLTETRNRTQQALGWPQRLLLRHAADEGELTTPDAADLIQRDTTHARNVLEQMVELGLLEAKGVKRNRSYHLSSSIYAYLGKRAAYVHRHGVDDMRKEEMVLQFTREFGRIKREDVLNLLPQLDKNQASYLLRRLASTDKLVPKGEKRGRYYVLPKS